MGPDVKNTLGPLACPWEFSVGMANAVAGPEVGPAGGAAAILLDRFLGFE